MKDAAEVFDCPHCGKPTKIPERLLGKKVRCPGCKEIFLAGGEPELDVLEEVKDDDYDVREAPRVKKRRYVEKFDDGGLDERRRPRRGQFAKEALTEPRWKHDERRRHLYSGIIASLIGFGIVVYGVKSGNLGFRSTYSIGSTLGFFTGVMILIAGGISIVRGLLR
jgi:hypothetical protein